jgi:hypothetical protein
MSSAMVDPGSHFSRHVDWASFVSRLFGCIDNRDWQGLSDILHVPYSAPVALRS